MKVGSQQSALAGCFGRLSLSSVAIQPSRTISSVLSCTRTRFNTTGSFLRAFSTTSPQLGNWLLPTQPEKKRSRKGRPRVPTGGSSRGTTIVWGDYGLRMKDHHRRVSAAQLKVGEDAIKVRLRGMKYRLYKRVCANIGVYSSGNEVCTIQSYSHSDLTTSRLVWEKEKVHLIIGHQELLSARSSLS